MLSLSVGVLTFSNIGYNVSQTFNETTTSPAYTKQVYGDGGLHQVYGGIGFKVFKNLSVGANMGFLWGNINRSLAMIYLFYTSSTGSSTTTPSYSEGTYVSVRGYKLDVGLQYTQPIGQKHSVTLGAVFSPGHHLSNEGYVQTATTVITTRDTVSTYGIPDSYGAGFTYKYDNQIGRAHV